MRRLNNLAHVLLPEPIKETQTNTLSLTDQRTGKTVQIPVK